MPKPIIALASALILAVIVTEMFTRVFSNSYWMLMVVFTLGLLLQSFVVLRVAARAPMPASAPVQDAPRSRNRDNKNRDGKRGRDRDGRGRNDRNDNKNNNRNRNDNRGERKGREEKPQKAQPQKAERAEPAEPKERPAPTPLPEGAKQESGTVKWFNRSKGYGFVVRENGEEIFVHQRSIVADGSRSRPVLQDGQDVKFVVTEHDKGLQAEHVTPV